MKTKIIKYEGKDLDRRLATDIMLEIFEETENPIPIEMIAINVIDYYETHGGSLSDDIDIKGIILMGLQDLRYKGFAESFKSKSRWIIRKHTIL